MSAKVTKSSSEEESIFQKKSVAARLADGSTIYANEFRDSEDYLILKRFKFSFVEGSKKKTYYSNEDEEYMIHKDALCVLFVNHKGRENEVPED